MGDFVFLSKSATDVRVMQKIFKVLVTTAIFKYNVKSNKSVWRAEQESVFSLLLRLAVLEIWISKASVVWNEYTSKYDFR